MSFAPQFRMSAGGESGQKGPAVSAQEAQMQAIMQQARVPLLLLLKYIVAIHFPCFLCTPVYILNVRWSQCRSSASARHAWPLRSNGFDRQTRSSGAYIYSPSPACFHAVVKDCFSCFVPVLRVLLVYQD